MLVFLFHYQIPIYGHPVWTKDVGKFGWTGVDLFFVLSGFLIASQLFTQVNTQKVLSLKNFFIKRFFRILPAFWVTVAIYFCFSGFHEREGLPSIWRFLTFTQNLGLDIKTYGTFSHAWSLCVEEHFYLVLPFLLVGLLNLKLVGRGFWILILLFIFGFFLRHFSWNLYEIRMEEENSWRYWYQYVYYPTYNRLDGLLVGVSIAAVYCFLPLTWDKIQKKGIWLFICGLLLLTGAYFLCYKERTYIASVLGFPLVALGYGSLLMSAISPTCFLYKWNSKVTKVIAALSFSIYLTHKGVIHVIQELLLKQDIDIDSNFTLVICIVSCIAVATLMYLLIERPFMKLRTRMLEAQKKHE